MLTPTVFALVALILTIVEMARGAYKGLLAWAVLFLALAHLWPWPLLGR